MLLLVGVWLTLLPSLHPGLDTLSAFRLYAVIPCLAALAWSVRCGQRKLAACGIASLAAVGLGLAPHVAWSDPEPKTGDRTMRILQANLRYDNQQHAALVDLILAQDADLIFLQEVSPTTQPVFDALKQHYPFADFAHVSHVGAACVLSKWAPVRESSDPEGKQVLGLLLRQLDTPVGPLHVGAIHMFWPWPYGQGEQRAAMEAQLGQLQGVVLLGGDFNAAPWSAAVRSLAKITRTAVSPGSYRPSNAKPCR